MSETVLTTLITSGVTLLGVIITQLATAANNRKKIRDDVAEEQSKAQKATEKKLLEIEDKLDTHIKNDSLEQAINKRVRILEFNENLYNNSLNWPSEGSFLQISIDCDDYEDYISSHEIPNGIAEKAIENIKEKYSFCKKSNLFSEKKIDN